jgi:hypothetical protein
MPALGLTGRSEHSQSCPTDSRSEASQIRSLDLPAVPTETATTAAAAGIARAEPDAGPQPPCGTEPVPAFPRVDEPANVKAWSASELGADWKPPACTGWTATGFTSLVTIAARFRHPAGADDVLRQVGAISQLGGIRYWSATHQGWRMLIKEAHALTDAQSGRARGDFAPEELKQGKALYFEQVDNLSGKAIYRMRILEASGDRIVLEIENVTTMKYFLVPVLHPGEMQSIYFMDRESEDVWRFYSMVRTGRNANHTIAGNEKSSINRAVAFYRYMVRIPTDQEPPPAR